MNSGSVAAPSLFFREERRKIVCLE
jgi:hypothetical protein